MPFWEKIWTRIKWRWTQAFSELSIGHRSVAAVAVSLVAVVLLMPFFVIEPEITSPKSFPQVVSVSDPQRIAEKLRNELIRYGAKQVTLEQQGNAWQLEADLSKVSSPEEVKTLLDHYGLLKPPDEYVSVKIIGGAEISSD
ncbi:MAG: hypothetical protein GY862_37700 [Gammaproteobacteria bacterium]|nr:hypothetical protein [Gammaproteobacteria bacterium]